MMVALQEWFCVGHLSSILNEASKFTTWIEGPD